MAEERENLGFLKIAVKTADGILPVADARVRITDNNGTEVILYTDKSGLTEKISLPAPGEGQSLSANGENPFAIYRVEVNKEGYSPQSTEWVPVFPGITSLQPILLIGLAEYESESLNPRESTETVKVNPQVLNR